VNVLGSDYIKYLTQEIDVDNIPSVIPGGKYPKFNSEFIFDTSPGGLLSLPASLATDTSGGKLCESTLGIATTII
jgi:hypothetical protein